MSPVRRADLAFFTAISFGLLFIVLGGPLGRRLEMVHMNDFSGFWSGPAAWLNGTYPWGPTYSDVAVAMGVKPPDQPIYDYMPWTALFLMPLALLPLEVAAWIWMIGSMTAATFALRALLRTYLPGMTAAHAALGLALFIGQPGFHAVVLGQWSLLLMSAVAAIVLLLRAARPRLAALPTLLMLAKPQIFVFTSIGLAYGALRRPVFRRYVALAAALGSVVVAVSWVLAGDWFPVWSAEILGRTERSAVLPSALSELVGPAGRWIAVAVILAGASVASRFTAGSDASLASWLSLSSAGAIYSWSYDQVLLLVPIVLTAGVLARESQAQARAFVLAWAGIFLVVSPLLYALAVVRHDETFSCAVPIAAFVSIVALLWRHRHDGDVESQRQTAGHPERVAGAA
jgi:hypothetical protein